MVVVEIKNLAKKYKVGDKESITVLNSITYSFLKGDFVAIIGKSGAGKTTLLNIIGGLDRDYEGEVRILDEDLKRMDDHKLSKFRNKHIGFVFQSFYLLPHLTCAENVALPYLFYKGDDKIDVEDRVRQCLEWVELEDKKDSYPSRLSGGQKQRVAIARALFMEPEIILCDEPTGNLDYETGMNILNILKRLNQEKKITILMVTHEEHIKEMADKVVLLKKGRLIEESK